MCMASLKDFVNHMKTYAKGNDFEGENYREGEFLLEPMFMIKYAQLGLDGILNWQYLVHLFLHWYSP